MQTTPEHSPGTYIHQKRQKLQKLLPEKYKVSVGVANQDIGKSAGQGAKPAGQVACNGN
jgi:hypothetical protein